MNVSCVSKIIDEDFKKWNECVKILAIAVPNNNKRRLNGEPPIRRRQLLKFHR